MMMAVTAMTAAATKSNSIKKIGKIMKKLFMVGLVILLGANLAACDKDGCPHDQGPIVPEIVKN